MKEMSIEDRLALSRFRPHDVPHIRINEDVCNGLCETKMCTVICPAKAYKKDGSGNITLNHENCLECGSCRIVCPEDNIEWNYPVWGKGVGYKHG